MMISQQVINRTMSGLQDRASIVHVGLHPGPFAMHLLRVFVFVEGILGNRKTRGGLNFSSFPNEKPLLLNGFDCFPSPKGHTDPVFTEMKLWQASITVKET